MSDCTVAIASECKPTRTRNRGITQPGYFFDRQQRSSMRMNRASIAEASKLPSYDQHLSSRSPSVSMGSPTWRAAELLVSGMAATSLERPIGNSSLPNNDEYHNSDGRAYTEHAMLSSGAALHLIVSDLALARGLRIPCDTVLATTATLASKVDCIYTGYTSLRDLDAGNYPLKNS